MSKCYYGQVKNGLCMDFVSSLIKTEKFSQKKWFQRKQYCLSHNHISYEERVRWPERLRIASGEGICQVYIIYENRMRKPRGEGSMDRVTTMKQCDVL